MVAINENAAADSVVLKVHASDDDAAGSANARIVYILAANSSQFTVDADGVIRTRHNQTQCPRSKCSSSGDCPRTCVLTVEARDSGEPFLTGRAYVYISLLVRDQTTDRFTNKTSCQNIGNFSIQK